MTYQLIMQGQLTGNAIDFGYFPTREAAMAKANGVNSTLYRLPKIIEIK
jgi:hypothetical protein